MSKRTPPKADKVTRTEARVKSESNRPMPEDPKELARALFRLAHPKVRQDLRARITDE